MTYETDSPDDPNLVFIGETVAFSVLIGLIIVSAGLVYVDALAQQNSHISEIVYKIYQEAALLGFVAFLVFIIGGSSISSSTLTQLESIHIAVFVILVVHILWIMTLLFFSYRIGNYWARIEKEYGNNFLAYKQVRERLATLNDQLQLSRFYSSNHKNNSPPVKALPCSCLRTNFYFLYILGICFHPILFTRYLRALHITRYLEQRYRFIRRNDLPYNFRFFVYLVGCKYHILIKLIRIPISIWLFLTFLIGIDTYIRSVWEWYRLNYNATAIIVSLCIGGILVSLLIWIKVRIIYWKIFHSEFASLQVSHEVVQKAVDWAAILPSGTGFGMSMRIRPSELTLPPLMSSLSTQHRIARLPSTSQLINRGSSLVIRAQEIEEELLRRQAFVREVSPFQDILPMDIEWDSIPPTSPDADAPTGTRDTRGLPELHEHRTSTSGNRRLPHATVLTESKYPNIPVLEEGGPDEPSVITTDHDRSIRPSLLVLPNNEPSIYHDGLGLQKYRQHLQAQKKLFWFQQPLFLLRLVQLVPFLFALAIALLALFFPTIISSTKDFILTFVVIGVGVVVCILLLRDIISLYILTIHVSDLVDTRLLAYSVLKHEQYHQDTMQENDQVHNQTVSTNLPQSSVNIYRIRYSFSIPLMQNFCILISIINIFLLAISSSAWIQLPYRRGVFITVIVLTSMLFLEYGIRTGVWFLTYQINKRIQRDKQYSKVSSAGRTVGQYPSYDNDSNPISASKRTISPDKPVSVVPTMNTLPVVFPIRRMKTMIGVDTMGMVCLLTGTIIGILYGNIENNTVKNKGAPMYVVGYFCLRILRLLLVDNNSDYQREIYRVSPFDQGSSDTSPDRKPFSSFITDSKDYPMHRQDLSGRISPHLLIQSPPSFFSGGGTSSLRLRKIPVLPVVEKETELITTRTISEPVKRSISFSGASAYTANSPMNHSNVHLPTDL